MAGKKGRLVKGRTITWTTHPQYNRWKSMWDRCTKAWSPKYKDYGARGISVCNRWRDFEMFLEDIDAIGACPPGHSLDRVDNNKGYEPGNVQWASSSDQIKNRRPYKKRKKSPSHTKTVIVVDGIEVSIAYAANILNINQRSLTKRLRRMRAANPNLPRSIEISELKN